MEKTLNDYLDKIVWEKRSAQRRIDKKTGGSLLKYIEWSKKNQKKLEKVYNIKPNFVSEVPKD